MAQGSVKRKRKISATKSDNVAQRRRTTSPRKNRSLNTRAISTRSKQSKESKDGANKSTDIQISKVESIDDDFFNTSGTNKEQEDEDDVDDCVIIEDSPVEVIDLVGKSLCRVCLNESCNEMIPLSSNLDVESQNIRLSECLSAIMKRQIFTSSNFPDSVCMDCFHRIISAYLLLTQLNKVEAKFEAMQLQNINEPSTSRAAKISKPNADENIIINKSPTTENMSNNNGITYTLTDDSKTETKTKQKRDTSKVNCLECNVQIDVGEIGKHLRVCKKNHLAINLPNGKCKVLVCKLCNTLVFMQNMKMHSQICKRDIKPFLNKQRPNTSSDNSNKTELRQIRQVEPIGVIPKDEGIKNPSAIITKTSGQVLVNSLDSTNQIVIQRVISPGENSLPALKERGNLSTIKRVADSTFKKIGTRNMQRNAPLPETKDAANINKLSVVVPKAFSFGTGLHPLEKEIRKQLMSQYMYSCKECCISFISLEALNGHKVKSHQMSLSTDITPDVSARST